MGLTVKESGGNFIPCPAGTHLGICISIYDLGTQTTPFKDEKTGETKRSKQVFIQWETPSELMPDGKPFVIGKFYTASLNEKANLRHDLEAWRARVFSAAELEGFSLTSILGKPCMLSVVQYQRADGTTGAKIGNVMAMPKGTKAPPPQNKIVSFDIDEWDDAVYRGLDEHWQKQIAQSDEARSRNLGAAMARTGGNGVGSGAQHEPLADDDIPF